MLGSICIEATGWRTGFELATGPDLISPEVQLAGFYAVHTYGSVRLYPSPNSHFVTTLWIAINASLRPTETAGRSSAGAPRQSIDYAHANNCHVVNWATLPLNEALLLPEYLW